MDLSMCGQPIDYLDSYRGNLALNVKVRRELQLSDVNELALKKLDGAVRDRVYENATESLRDWWWASMEERAQSLFLGKIYSAGRSGGWLIFPMTVSAMNDRIYETERLCKYCPYSFDDHVDGKCPFESTSFAPEHVDVPSLLERYKAFALMVKESLDTIDAAFDAEITFQLENLSADDAASIPA